MGVKDKKSPHSTPKWIVRFEKADGRSKNCLKIS